MLAALVPDRPAVEEEPARRTPIITTLYDLMAALHAASAPGEEDLVTAAVVDLCHTGRLRFLARPYTPVTIDACMSWHERKRGHERLRNILPMREVFHVNSTISRHGV